MSSSVGYAVRCESLYSEADACCRRSVRPASFNGLHPRRYTAVKGRLLQRLPSNQTTDRQFTLSYCQVSLTFHLNLTYLGSMESHRLENRLKIARAERGLSQDQLAQLVGVSRQTISSIETGQYCPSALLAFILAARLGKPIDELFRLDEDGVES